MKNYENRLTALEKIADGKNAQVVILDYKNGEYYQDGKQVDVNTIKADAIIIDDIPDLPPEIEKGSEEDCPENEYQTRK